MTHDKDTCLKSVDLLLGWPLKKAPHEKVLKLFAVSICGLTVERCLAGKKGKRSAVSGNLGKIANILYKETLRRMEMKNKTR